MNFRINGKDHTGKFRPTEIRRSRFECICACLGILFFIPLVSIPESRYGRYWANQGLIILIVELICALAGLIVGGLLTLFGMIPLIGFLFRLLKVLVIIVLSLVSLFYVAWGIYTVCRGKAQDVPVIGGMRFIK